MINANMRDYEYYLYGDDNGYGQATLSKEVQGTVKMSIDTTTQTTQDNINYKNAKYIGLTHSAIVTDKFVFKNGEELLKVLYVQPKGRYKQVFMGSM